MVYKLYYSYIYIIINESDLIDAVYFDKDGNIYDDSEKKKILNFPIDNDV